MRFRLTLAIVVGFLCSQAHAQTAIPRYEVDTSWPKPLPDRWVLGGLGGVCVDHQDHVVLLNRQDVQPGDLDAGRLAPPIIEIDPEGNVVHSWGDLRDLDPRLHSCHFDQDDNIWIASSPSGMVRKYSHDGSKLLLQIGEKGKLDSSDGTEKGAPLNSNAARFFMPSSIAVDRGSGDILVADGESRGGNRRIEVLDREGKFLHQWQPQGMETVHSMAVSNDGIVYVCNREGARIQLYEKTGKFIRNIEVPWKPFTQLSGDKPRQSGGVTVALDFSPDTAQRFIYLINQNNAQIEIIDRQSGTILSSFGRAGHFPGEFDQPHGIALDSKGNVYIAENRGRRVQKFRMVPR